VLPSLLEGLRSDVYYEINGALDAWCIKTCIRMCIGHRMSWKIVSDIEIVHVWQSIEAWDVAAEVVGGSVERCEIWQLVDETPQPRCTQAIAIPNDPRDCEIFRLPSWCGAIEAKVPCFAADVMISPSGCDVLRVGSNDALEPLDDEVGIW